LAVDCKDHRVIESRPICCHTTRRRNFSTENNLAAERNRWLSSKAALFRIIPDRSPSWTGSRIYCWREPSWDVSLRRSTRRKRLDRWSQSSRNISRNDRNAVLATNKNYTLAKLKIGFA